ncbi:O-antigen ligase family protein [Palleronia abyssalis]|uniref:O-antigen ligase domain-containing protein n=1 Tax=Palleronia abyssalis TaxID=1501240 RepID=A0A2R8BYG5_9RHOB|nr:O-antigen ligase family protein [Palleronia abyssalis]SPJ25217.1 hypothetical protein PAA8504_03067 [Palleronia abyssalis]
MGPTRLRDRAAPALGHLDAKLAALTVFLSPMNYFRLEQVYLTLSDAAACATLFVMLYRGSMSRAPFGIVTPLWLAGFLALAAGLTIGSVASGAMGSLVVILAQYFFSFVLLVFVLAGRPYREIVALLKTLILSIVVVMVFGAYVVHFVPNPDWRFVSGNGRMRSLVERENAAAALGAIGIVLLLNLALLGEVRRMATILCLPIFLYGVTLTGSNTGLFMTTLGIILTVAFSGSARFIVQTALAAGAVVIVVVFLGDAILPDVFRERVMTALTSGDVNQAGTFEDRFYLIGEAIEIAQNTLVVGLGADQYRTISDHGAPVHNSYLLLLTEGGLLALSGLVMLLLSGITLAWVAIFMAGARTQGLIALTITLIYAASLNTFAHFYARFWSVPLILALGLAAARIDQKNRRP